MSDDSVSESERIDSGTIEFSSKAKGFGSTKKIGTLITGQYFSNIKIRCSLKDYGLTSTQYWITNHLLTRLVKGGKIHISIYEM